MPKGKRPRLPLPRVARAEGRTFCIAVYRRAADQPINREYRRLLKALVGLGASPDGEETLVVRKKERVEERWRIPLSLDRSLADVLSILRFRVEDKSAISVHYGADEGTCGARAGFGVVGRVAPISNGVMVDGRFEARPGLSVNYGKAVREAYYRANRGALDYQLARRIAALRQAALFARGETDREKPTGSTVARVLKSLGDAAARSRVLDWEREASRAAKLRWAGERARALAHRERGCKRCERGDNCPYGRLSIPQSVTPYTYRLGVDRARELGRVAGLINHDAARAAQVEMMKRLMLHQVKLHKALHLAWAEGRIRWTETMVKYDNLYLDRLGYWRGEYLRALTK